MEMTKDQEEQFAQVHLERSLDQTVPELANYLKKGTKVLDVGCGPGTITMGVANAVKPGQVHGLDPVEHHIKLATDLAKSKQIKNVQFIVGDGHALPFADETFDLVYSHTVLHYFFDPERALQEQRRVVKRGGWIVAAGVRDWDWVKRYPACPAWDSLLEARGSWSRLRQEKRNRKGDDRQFGHTQAARRCPEWFSSVGLKDLKVTIKVESVEYAGAELMGPKEMDYLPWEGPDTFGLFTLYSKEYAEMIAAGLIDQETVDRAKAEAKAWYEDPRAFHFWTLACIAGRA